MTPLPGWRAPWSIVLGAISLGLAIHGAGTLVALLLTGYAMVTQCFPGVVLGIYWKRVTGSGVFIGMIAGVVIAVALMSAHLDPIVGLNAGFVALCINFVVTIAASLATPGACHRSAARADLTISSAATGSTPAQRPSPSAPARRARPRRFCP